MSNEIFTKLISQLCYQSKVELHLFGDPFCDKLIYDRIEMLNNRGIVPSFSTNLISLQNINLNKLRKLKIGNLTISCDTDENIIFSEIRGKITEEEMKKCFAMIETLANFVMKTDCIDKIILQKIKMLANQKRSELIEKIVTRNKKCIYVEKEYIEFPGETKTNLGRNTIYAGNEKILLYHLLGKKTPFKCLKVWDKKEQGITSDGDMVPCCLTYNSVMNFGNINKEYLSEIQSANLYTEFRKSIWSGENVNSICDICFQSSQIFFHSRITKKDRELLKDYCIEEW